MPDGEWIDPDGQSWTLHVEYDARGLFAPPVKLEEDAIPGQPGMKLRGARHDAREFALSLYWRDDDPAALWTALRQYVAAMDPVAGTGTLRVSTPVGDQRQIDCIAVSGLDLTQTLGEASTPTHQRATVVFRAHDPYWQATSDVAVDYTLGSTATFFPIFPIRLTTGSTFADATVDNPGDIEAWPVWAITGPAGATITLRNLTTGKSLALGSLSLSSGEVATIDTRPGVKTLTRQDGTNLFPNVNGSLWSLRKGSNAIRVELSGATAATSVHLAYRPKWLTP